MSKFFYNRATTRICAKKPFIVIECNCDCFGFGKFPINNCVLYSLGWTNLKTTVKTDILPLNVINDQLVTFFWSQWMSVFRPKFSAAGSPTNLRNVQLAMFFPAPFLLLVGSGPKRSMAIEKLGSSSLVSSIFQREGKLHCSLTGRKLWSQVKKNANVILFTNGRA